VDLESPGVGVNSNSDLKEVGLEGVYLRGTSPGAIRTLTEVLSSADAPTLRKLALTPAFEEKFSEAVAELIMACGSQLTSFAWLPSIHFRSSLGPINLSTLHHVRFLYFIVNFRYMEYHKPFAQPLAMLSQISDRAEGNSIEKVSLECHCITPIARHAGEKALARMWQPLDNALSGTSELGTCRRTTFAKLKEVEVVLSSGTISPVEIRWVTARKGELLPSVEAQGVALTMKVRRSREEMGLLHQLREM